MQHRHIGIIGGGLTGMVAAYELCKKGYRVTLFESGNELGGLASGFKINGSVLEKAYHHLFTTDSFIIDLALELKLGDELLYCKNSTAIYFDKQLYPFTSPFDLITFKPLPWFSRIRFGIITMYLKHLKNWKKISKISARDWLKKWYGEEAYLVIWEPLLKGKFHEYHGDISMAWLWARIHTRANSSKGGEEKLIYFKNGFQILIKKLQEKIEEKGVRIQFSSSIKSISTIEEVPEIIMSDNTRYSFHSIVSTIPTEAFVNLIKNNEHSSKKYLDQLSSIKYLGTLLVVFASPQSLSSYYWHNINEPDSPFLVFLQHTNLVEKQNYQNEHIYYLGTYIPHNHRYFHMSQEEIFLEFFDYLKKIFPLFDKNMIHEKFIFLFKNAQHVVDTYYEQKIPQYKTPLPNVYLANFSQIFPEDRGTNFAVREGIKVAQFIHELLALRMPAKISKPLQ